MKLKNKINVIERDCEVYLFSNIFIGNKDIKMGYISKDINSGVLFTCGSKSFSRDDLYNIIRIMRKYEK